MKRAFKMKQKAFFIIFKGLSMKQIAQFVLEGESPTLISNLKWKVLTFTIKKLPRSTSPNRGKVLFT